MPWQARLGRGERCSNDIVPHCVSDKIPCICDECSNVLRLLQLKQEELERQKQIELQREFEQHIHRERELRRNLELQRQQQYEQERLLEQERKHEQRRQFEEERRHKDYNNDPTILRFKEQISLIGIRCVNSNCINNYDRESEAESYICELCFAKNMISLQKRIYENNGTNIKLKSINWIINKCQNTIIGRYT